MRANDDDAPDLDSDDVLTLSITRQAFDALAEVLEDTEFRDGDDRVTMSLYEITPGVAYLSSARYYRFYKTRRGFLAWLFGRGGL